jgi:hypothetical protein
MTELFKYVNTGQKCTFYMISPCEEKEIMMFKANFIDIKNRRLRVNNVECEKETTFHNCGIMTMPLDWITKIETLDNNGCVNPLLPSEIMVKIK